MNKSKVAKNSNKKTGNVVVTPSNNWPPVGNLPFNIENIFTHDQLRLYIYLSRLQSGGGCIDMDIYMKGFKYLKMTYEEYIKITIDIYILGLIDFDWEDRIIYLVGKRFA